MDTRGVVVTGISGITAFDRDWQNIQTAFKAEEDMVKCMDRSGRLPGLEAQLDVPIEGYAPPEHWTRKQLRSIGCVPHLCVDVVGQALTDAGLPGDESITDGRMGMACGSSVGSTKDIGDMGELLITDTSRSLDANAYVRMMPHTTAANIGIFLGLKECIIPASSTYFSDGRGVGYAYEVIRCGIIDMILAGGGEGFCPSEVYVFDLLHAVSHRSGEPRLTPRPYDSGRDGLVIGEGAGILVLGELEHARVRGVKIYTEFIGYGANSDGSRVAQPQKETMRRYIEFTLKDAGITPDKVDYVSGHGTATEKGDIVKTLAIEAVFEFIPMNSRENYLDHAFGTCGTLETWFTIEMMNSGWSAPTVNLESIDPHCGRVDYIRTGGREAQTSYVVSNNFAFGGVNTPPVFKRRQE